MSVPSQTSTSNSSARSLPASSPSLLSEVIVRTSSGLLFFSRPRSVLCKLCRVSKQKGPADSPLQWNIDSLVWCGGEEQHTVTASPHSTKQVCSRRHQENSCCRSRSALLSLLMRAVLAQHTHSVFDLKPRNSRTWISLCQFAHTCH